MPLSPHPLACFPRSFDFLMFMFDCKYSDHDKHHKYWEHVRKCYHRSCCQRA